eukprot:3497132-Pyramimonas_sp.AAC.1
MHETPVHAAPSVKYLGAKQCDDGTMVDEVAHRIKGGNAAHARLARRAFKGNCSVRLRVR